MGKTWKQSKNCKSRILNKHNHQTNNSWNCGDFLIYGHGQVHVQWTLYMVQAQNMLSDDAGMLFSILEAMQEGGWDFQGSLEQPSGFNLASHCMALGTSWLFQNLSLKLWKQPGWFPYFQNPGKLQMRKTPGNHEALTPGDFNNDCVWKPDRLGGATLGVSHKAFLPRSSSSTG